MRCSTDLLEGTQSGEVFGLTGKPLDAESGLQDFGARFYSPAAGRFLSPDWSADPEAVPYGDLTNPQSLNLYTLNNNPLRAIDPDGHPEEDGPNCGNPCTVTAKAVEAGMASVEEHCSLPPQVGPLSLSNSRQDSVTQK